MTNSFPRRSLRFEIHVKLTVVILGDSACWSLGGAIIRRNVVFQRPTLAATALRIGEDLRIAVGRLDSYVLVVERLDLPVDGAGLPGAVGRAGAARFLRLEVGSSR